MNRNRKQHIITIEDPIEILHPDHGCIVNQREVGLDTESFGQALRRALRQDPDTILIGELRDAETAQTALQAAESGHLVLSTLHTIDAAETVGRMIEFFPPEKQEVIRSIMAGVLRGVISQRLLPKVDGGRVAAVEVMVMNARIADLIREGRADEITDAVAEGDFFQMQTFTQALIEHVLSGAVDSEVAANAVDEPPRLPRLARAGGQAEARCRQRTPTTAPQSRSTRSSSPRQCRRRRCRQSSRTKVPVSASFRRAEAQMRRLAPLALLLALAVLAGTARAGHLRGCAAGARSRSRA